MIALETWSRQEGFDAAVLAAKTQRSGTFGIDRPRQRVVAPLAGNGVGTVENFAAHDNAGAHSGPKDRAKDDAGALPRAIDRLRQREAVGIIGPAYLAFEQRFEIGLDRPSIETDRVRAAQQPGRDRQRARRAKADAAASLELRFGVAHQGVDLAQRRNIIVAGSGDAPAQQLPTDFIERND